MYSSGITILHGMTDALMVAEATLVAAQRLRGCLSLELIALRNFVFHTFLGEERLK